MNETLSSLGADIQKTQWIAIAASVALFIYIFNLVRKKRIKEEYSLLWLFFSAVFLFFSIWRGMLEEFAAVVGIAYPPAALFLILLLAIFLILIEFSIIISKLSERNQTLAQELGLLRMDLDKLKEDNINQKPKDPTVKGH